MLSIALLVFLHQHIRAFVYRVFVYQYTKILNKIHDNTRQYTIMINVHEEEIEIIVLCCAVVMFIGVQIQQ